MNYRRILGAAFLVVVLSLGIGRAQDIPRDDLVPIFAHDDQRDIDEVRMSSGVSRPAWLYSKEDLAAAVKDANIISQDFGAWLGDGSKEILISLFLEGTSNTMANNRMNFLLVVVEAETRKRLTPVYHFFADHAELIHMHGNRQDFPVLIGHMGDLDGWFNERSVLLRFARGSVEASPVIGTLNPMRYAVKREGSTLSLLKLEGWYREDPRQFQGTPRWSSQLLRWNPDVGTFSAVVK